MSEIQVAPLGPGRWSVEVRQGEVRTTHRVSVPAGLLDVVGIAAAGEARVVHETFVFLCEREPTTSILREFSLERVASYFPDFFDELRARCGT